MPNAVRVAPHVAYSSVCQAPPNPTLSWQSRAANAVLMLTVKPLLEVAPVNPTTVRLVDNLYVAVQAVMQRLPRFVRVQPVNFGHFDGEWVSAGEHLRTDAALLYLHGGGYCFSSAAAHRPLTWRLSRMANRPVLAINYRQGVGHQFEFCRDDAVQAYQHLLTRYAPENIVIGGDSAGGHLTLITLQALRDAGLPMPCAALCFSPWTDLSCESPSYQRNRFRDPMFSSRAVSSLARYFVRSRDHYDPLISPLHGDFSGLPPLLITAGSTEVLRDDSRRLAQRAQAFGVQVQYEEWRGMPHVFQLFAQVLPEARASFRNMAAFIGKAERARATDAA